MKKVLIALAVLLSAGIFFSCGGNDRQGGAENSKDRVFKFSAISDQNQSGLELRNKAIADYLAKELGVKVEYVPVKGYDATVTAFKKDEVQLGWFGGYTGLLAIRAVPGSKAIAQGEDDPNFQSYLIANVKNTGLNLTKEFPKDLKKYSFTFGSTLSTSGRLMPEYFIRKENGDVAPKEVFKSVAFQKNHDEVITAVEAGTFDIGAVNYKKFNARVKKDPTLLERVRIIWKTPGYQDYNWTIRGDVDKKFGEGFTEKVQKAIVELKDEKILEMMKRSNFIKTDNKMFENIEKTAKELKLID